MVTYDAELLYEFADRLYARANQAIVTSVLMGIVIGGGGGYLMNRQLDRYAAIGAALAGLVGYVVGSERAFQLKLQAQTALCQVKMEENTRKQ
jgi:hypothetical protein